MSLTLVHSADWQLGARFAQFSEQAARLRQIRIETLSRALSLAAERQADAFLIAGDLFEDNQVDQSLVEEVVSLFESSSPLPILILPGNHDPYSGPDSVWDRPIFQSASAHIHVFRDVSSFALKGGHILAAPLQQKVSTLDPSLALDEWVSALPEKEVKIGVTHGALAVPGKHQANDFPIALDAASRAGLDYLALGHWHQWQVYDDGRIVMPGTPEPDDFGQDRAGSVALVRLGAAGESPEVEPIAVGKLRWHRMEYSLGQVEESRTRIHSLLEHVGATIEHSIVRVHLTGAVEDEVREGEKKWLSQKLAGVFALQIRDDSQTRLSAAELALLGEKHPLIELVLADLERLQQLLSLEEGEGREAVPSSIGLVELQKLLDAGRIPLASLESSHLEAAREWVVSKLREVAS